MAEKVKLSKDGSSIDFVQSETIPTSVKKFRQSPEIEGFYRFIFENDLQKEALEILERIIAERKAKKQLERIQQKSAKGSRLTKADQQLLGISPFEEPKTEKSGRQPKVIGKTSGKSLGLRAEKQSAKRKEKSVKAAKAAQTKTKLKGEVPVKAALATESPAKKIAKGLISSGKPIKPTKKPTPKPSVKAKGKKNKKR
jgi:hypothetical protein